MKKSIMLVTMSLLLLTAVSAYAGNAKGDCLKDKLRLKDGSCQVVAALQIQKKDCLKLKDGSCQDVAKLQTRTQDKLRLKDGSCQDV